MGKLRGFIEFDRITEENIPVHSRVKNYKEFTLKPTDKELEKQGSRSVSYTHLTLPTNREV